MDQNIIRLAILIDADNVSATVLEGLFSEIAGIGEATVKRIYGDFTSSYSAQWKDNLNKYAIKPMQQFAYTTGKNATDSALIIDAMDLLHTGRFDGFCLVSSDSDFTGLAVRIKEEGLQVYGFGEHKTPEAFRNACNKFTFTEVLSSGMTLGASTIAKTKDPASSKSKNKSVPADISKPDEDIPISLIKTAIEDSCDDSGIALLSKVGHRLVRLKPDFDTRLYGYSKIKQLLQSKPDMFEIVGDGLTVAVKMKP